MGDWSQGSAAVTAEWLDTVMRRNGVLASARVKSVRAANLGLGVARALFFYPREVSFYTKLAQYSPIRTPRLFHAQLDMADHSFVLLLEDMRNAILGDQIAGLMPPQAEAAITAIGRLHGAWRRGERAEGRRSVAEVSVRGDR